jgi:WD40 repeat protein
MTVKFRSWCKRYGHRLAGLWRWPSRMACSLAALKAVQSRCLLLADLIRRQVWDLETFQCIRMLSGHSDDILALTAVNSVVFSGSAGASSFSNRFIV